VKGDRVEILVDVGNDVRRFEIVATRAGRRVTVAPRDGMVEVAEVTRSGTPVRSGRFMATRVVAVVEHPVGGESHDERPLIPMRQRIAERGRSE
jgi:hypothetical protein